MRGVQADLSVSPQCGCGGGCWQQAPVSQKAAAAALSGPERQSSGGRQRPARQAETGHQSRQAQGTALQAGLGQGGTLLKVSGGQSPRRRQDVAANQLTTSYRISHIGQGCVESDEQADMTPALQGPAIQQMARVSCELPGRSAGTLQA